jgi:putative phosphoesterase
MRVAVISDIHGNIWALEAILRDMADLRVEQVINLGDLLSGPLEPAATADLLMSKSWPTLHGNHDRQLLACESHPGAFSDQYAYEHTTHAHREWLRGLPSVLQLKEAGILAFHGSPSDDLTYFLEDVSPIGASMALPDVIEQRATGIDARLILCGHTHKPRVVSMSGGRLVVNPGSVGLPAYDDDVPYFHVMENGSPHARYALCQRTREPQGWNVGLRCVAYEYEKAAAAARRHGSEKWARWIETGRA